MLLIYDAVAKCFFKDNFTVYEGTIFSNQKQLISILIGIFLTSVFMSHNYLSLRYYHQLDNFIYTIFEKYKKNIYNQWLINC